MKNKLKLISDKKDGMGHESQMYVLNLWLAAYREALKNALRDYAVAFFKNDENRTLAKLQEITRTRAKIEAYNDCINLITRTA